MFRFSSFLKLSSRSSLPLLSPFAQTHSSTPLSFSLTNDPQPRFFSLSSKKESEKRGEKEIKIDTKGLKSPRPFSQDFEQFATEPSSSSSSSITSPLNSEREEKEGDLKKYLRAMISISGPITLATFMKECLTHPIYGYYMRDRSSSSSSSSSPNFAPPPKLSSFSSPSPSSSSSSSPSSPSSPLEQERNEKERTDIFGVGGDFTTSPEVHQMFGETIAALFVDCWFRLGKPQINLIEFGPGRGTLMDDILRTGKQFPGFLESVNLHFVEVSPYLRKKQWQKLRCRELKEEERGENEEISLSGKNREDELLKSIAKAAEDSSSSTSSVPIQNREEEKERHTKAEEEWSVVGKEPTMTEEEREREEETSPLTKRVVGVSGEYGVKVVWHVDADRLPSGPCLVIGHEFLDALPVHRLKFSRLGGWKEILIDHSRGLVNNNSTPERREEGGREGEREGKGEGKGEGEMSVDDGEREMSGFRYVLSSHPTPTASLCKPFLPPYKDSKEGMVVEVCPQGVSLAVKLAKHLEKHSGIALFVDYGLFESFSDSLRAIKNHKFCDMFTTPGEVDLSAMVDFQALHRGVTKEVAKKGKVTSYPSISQRNFLENLGIDARVVSLLRDTEKRFGKKKGEREAEKVIRAFNRLVSEMGDEYQVYAISSDDVPLDEYLRE